MLNPNPLDQRLLKGTLIILGTAIAAVSNRVKALESVKKETLLMGIKLEFASQ